MSITYQLHQHRVLRKMLVYLGEFVFSGRVVTSVLVYIFNGQKRLQLPQVITHQNHRPGMTHKCEKNDPKSELSYHGRYQLEIQFSWE